MDLKLKLCLVFLVAAIVFADELSAQQHGRSGAVEEFSAAFDVGVMMQPRVGLFGITELMMAALHADLDEVKRLVEQQGNSLAETDATGGTPLMWAVQGGSLEIVNYMLDSGADVAAVGNGNSTALMTAVIYGEEDIGVRLLDAGATFSGELSYQQDYLEYAAAKGQSAMVRALLQHGADIEGSGPDALCFAIEHGELGAARALVEAGVDVNRPGNHRNDYPMVHAAKSGDLAFVRLLVEAGADLNRKDKADRLSILFYATRTGQPSMVSYLIENGAIGGPEEVDQLLARAVYQGSKEMVETYVTMGATLSTRHVFMAVSNDHDGMADDFLDAIGIESIDDYTMDMLIDHASMHGHQAMVDKLLGVIMAQEAGGHLRLLFETAENNQCSLMTYSAQDRAVASTVLDEYSCDAMLFTSKYRNSLFVLHEEQIDIYSIDKEFPAFSLNVPTTEINARRDELGRQFTKQWSGVNIDWISAKIVAIGYTDDDQVAVITHTGGPADGTYASMFAWNGSTWAMVDTQNCGRFDGVCHMQGLDGQSIDRWPLRGAVWHAALQRNPGFVDRAVQNGADAGDTPTGTVSFEFDGSRSVLGYTTSGSDHCDGECTFTDSVTINPDGIEPTRFALANYRVSIADRYMLLRPIPATLHTRLYDLVTGEDVLGEISRATWIH